jgi:hypothetical protein
MAITTSFAGRADHPGLNAVLVTGVGLQPAASQSLRDEVEAAEALVVAIMDSLARARTDGVAEFSPDDARLTLPDTLQVSQAGSAATAADQLRTRLFERVVGHPFRAADERPSQPADLPQAGPLSLAQWSDAVSALRRFAAQARSKLSPGEGGGPQMAEGAWYLNGERFTTVELFLAIRMGNFQNLERQIEKGLSSVAVNAVFARDVLSSLSEMLRIRGNKAQAGGDAATVEYDPTTDFKDVIEKARDGRTRTMEEYEELAGKLNRTTSYIKEAAAAQRSDGAILAVDYASLINEMRTLFDTLNADNQVQQLRVESIQNARNNVLDSVSYAIKGFNLEASAVRRNLM